MPNLPSASTIPNCEYKIELNDGTWDPSKVDLDDSIPSFWEPGNDRGNYGDSARRDHGNGAQQRGVPQANWQTWLLATLEEHRNSITMELASQFDSFRNSSSDETIEGRIWQHPRSRNHTESMPMPDCSSAMSEAVTKFTNTSSLPRPSTVSRRNKYRKVGSAFSQSMTQQDFEEVKRVARDITTSERVTRECTFTKVTETIGFELSAVLGMRTAEDEHPRLDLIIALVIFANVASMMVELEYESYNSQIALGWVTDTDEWPNAPTIFKVVDHLFNALFVVEGCYRIYLDGLSYFRFRLNILDFCLILIASVQIYILEPWGAATGEKLTLFRMIRFIRFVRILKVMRLRAFADLRVLVKTCISSLAALMWSMVLLFLIIIMSGLFLCSLLKATIQDTEVDRELRVWLYRHYGSSARASYTLFEVTLAGCWPTYFRPLIEKVSFAYGIFAVLYITLIVFAVIRIITAIFLKQTLQVASSDAEMMVNEQRIQTQKNAEKLKGVFQAVDTAGKGVLTFDDFMRVASNADVRAWLQNFELAVHDVEGLFCLLDDGDGEITYDEFIQGIMRLKGQARSLDVVAIGCHCDKIQDGIQALGHSVDTILNAMKLGGGSSSPKILKSSGLRSAGVTSVQSTHV